MNKKIALILACCAATSFAACNETTEWNFTESCGGDDKRCVESTIQVCKDGVWVPEVTCEGATPWCDVTTHTCIAKPAAKDCQDGAQKCDQDAVWTCKTGKWEKTTDCAADGKVCNSTTFVCDPKAQPEVTCDHNGIKLAVGATVCDGETTLKTCTANADGTTASLTSTDCSTDNKVCGNDAENKAACIDAQPPAPTVKCTKDGDETEYEVGAKYCDDNTLYTCTASADGTTATFESAACQGNTPVCDNTANDCRAYNKCTLNNAPVAHDATVCDGNVSKKCNDGTLETVKDCATDAQVCLATSGVCYTPEANDCTNETPTIPNGTTVCVDINKVTCTNGTTSSDPCTTTVGNATATCSMIDEVATCGFNCDEGYTLSEDKTGCDPIPQYTTVSAIRAAYDTIVDSATCSVKETSNTVVAADVKLNGVVTGIRTNGKGIFIQDTTGGIQINCTNGDCIKYADDSNVAIGDSVEIVADGVGQYFCDLQVRALSTTPVDVKKLTTPLTEITPEVIILTDLTNNGAKNAKLGKLVTIANIKAGTYNTSNKSNHYWPVSQGTDNFTVVAYLMATDVLQGAMVKDKVYAVTGIPVYTFNEVRLAPRSAVDILEECADGSYVCDPATNTYKSCFWGTWSEPDSCSQFGYTSNANATSFACNTANDGCVITACSAGYKPTTDGKECEADTPAVENNCSSDMNNNKPELGAYFCVNKTTWNFCSDTTGQDMSPSGQACGDNKICNPATINTLVACEEKCADNAIKCDGENKYSLCVSGEWIDGNVLPGQKCEGDKLTCIEASTCFDNEWYSCDSGTGNAKKEKSCKTQSGGNTVCGTQPNECVAATPATCEPKCEEIIAGSVKKVKVTTCSAEGKATTNEYTDKSCKSATEVGVCLNGAKQCATGSTVGIETCANGEWGTAVACSSTDADAETFECAEATCKIQTCNNGKTPSEDGMSCVAGGGTTPAAWELLKAFTVKKDCQGGTACKQQLQDIGIYFNSNDMNLNASANYVTERYWNNNNSKDANEVYGNTNSSKSRFVGYRFTSTDGKAVRLSLGIERNNATDSAKDYQCALYKGGVFKLLSSDTINITTKVKTPFSCSFNVSDLSVDDKTGAEIRIIGYNAAGGAQTKFYEAKIEVQK